MKTLTVYGVAVLLAFLAGGISMATWNAYHPKRAQCAPTERVGASGRYVTPAGTLRVRRAVQS